MRRISIFFPLAFTLIGVMVWAALRPGLERQELWRAELSSAAREGFSISDDRLFNFTANDNAEFEVVGPRGARRAILRSSGEFARNSNHGVHYLFPIELMRLYEGGRVRLEFLVRSSAQQESRAMFVRCAAAGVMDSGWMRVPIGVEWEIRRVECDVPRGAARAGFSAMVWSDADGEGGWIELREARVLPREAGDGPGA